MKNFTTVVAIAVYTGCAIVASASVATSPAHAVTQEQMDLDTMEIENIERDARMKRMDDELQRIRDQLYYMRERTTPSVPCGNCAFR